MTRREKIIEVMEYVFANTKRIHGNSEAIDWQKVAIHKSADAILALPLETPSEVEIKEESLNGQISLRDPKWTYWLNDTEQEIFIMGAKWAIEQVKERNK